MEGSALADAGYEGDEAPSLTRRQHQVLELLAGGLTDAQIADELGISETTVKSHLSQLAEQLGMRRRAGLVARGITLGLLRKSR